MVKWPLSVVAMGKHIKLVQSKLWEHWGFVSPGANSIHTCTWRSEVYRHFLFFFFCSNNESSNTHSFHSGVHEVVSECSSHEVYEVSLCSTGAGLWSVGDWCSRYRLLCYSTARLCCWYPIVDGGCYKKRYQSWWKLLNFTHQSFMEQKYFEAMAKYYFPPWGGGGWYGA